MILELDAGNTRIKWRLLEQGKEPVTRAQDAVLAIEKVPGVFVDLAGQLEQLPLDRVSRTRVASVRGPVFDAALASLMWERWRLQPAFAAVTRGCAGLTNGYEDVGRLGVDRWLAMLAAWTEARGACCVLDCGSAVTLDVIDAEGRHLGGHITPGLHLMLDALWRRSEALRFEPPPDWLCAGPGRGPRDAIEGGILNMLLGFTERAHRQYGDQAHWFITGGDAPLVARHLDWPHRVEPDLVMDGLGVAMEEV